MKISINDIETLVFYQSDGSTSSAVKIVYRPTAKEYVCDDYPSQVQNRRKALYSLISDFTSDFKVITNPKYVLFDPIRVIKPNSEKKGLIRELIWHFKNCEWNYYIDSDGKKVSKRYVESDLELNF